MAKKVNETVSRPARTGIQGGVAWALLEVVDSTFWDMPERAYGGLLVLLTTALGALQTVTENKLNWALLRDLPARKQPIIENVDGRHEKNE